MEKYLKDRKKRKLLLEEIEHYMKVAKAIDIPVHQIVRMLANGDIIEKLLEEYPSLKRDDILACLDYAATLAEEQQVKEKTKMPL